jgi:hypothetical protein
MIACLIGAVNLLPKVVLICPVLNMYSQADEGGDAVSQAIFGMNIDALDSAAGWAKIRTPDRYTATVQERYWTSELVCIRRPT